MPDQNEPQRLRKIEISVATANRLKSIKVSKHETYDEIINRMFEMLREAGEKLGLLSKKGAKA